MIQKIIMYDLDDINDLKRILKAHKDNLDQQSIDNMSDEEVKEKFRNTFNNYTKKSKEVLVLNLFQAIIKRLRCKMGLSGDLIKGTGTLLGGATKLVATGAGEIVGGIAEIAGNDELADIAREVGDVGGEIVGQVVKRTGYIAGSVVDIAVDISAEIGGTIGGTIAEASGATEEGIEISKAVGKAVGGAAVGFMVGEVIGTAVTGITAATGTASTGTAISTIHGAVQTNATLAAIGGGALTTGGAGMAGGQLVLNSISATATVAGSIQSINKKNTNTNQYLPYNTPKKQQIAYTPNKQQVASSPNKSYINRSKKNKGLYIGIGVLVGGIVAYVITVYLLGDKKEIIYNEDRANYNDNFIYQTVDQSKPYVYDFDTTSYPTVDMDIYSDAVEKNVSNTELHQEQEVLSIEVINEDQIQSLMVGEQVKLDVRIEVSLPEQDIPVITYTVDNDYMSIDEYGNCTIKTEGETTLYIYCGEMVEEVVVKSVKNPIVERTIDNMYMEKLSSCMYILNWNKVEGADSYRVRWRIDRHREGIIEGEKVLLSAEEAHFNLLPSDITDIEVTALSNGIQSKTSHIHFIEDEQSVGFSHFEVNNETNEAVAYFSRIPQAEKYIVYRMIKKSGPPGSENYEMYDVIDDINDINKGQVIITGEDGESGVVYLTTFINGVETFESAVRGYTFSD